MNAKRPDRPDDQESYFAEATVVAESARAAARPAESKDEERMSLFWRVFGGTILSIAALVAVTIYNGVAGSIAELRAEISRLHEAKAELVKKDEFNTRISTNYDRVQTLQTQNNVQNATLTSLRTELDGIKERLVRQSADLDGSRKDSVTAIDSLKKDVSVIEAVKERTAAVAADLKGVRDDVSKLRTETDRNSSYDAERKAFRDEQARAVEKALRDLQVAITECQVKLARLEAVQQVKPKSEPRAEKAQPAAKGPTPEKIAPPKEGEE